MADLHFMLTFPAPTNLPRAGWARAVRPELGVPCYAKLALPFQLNRLWRLVRARKVDLVLVWKFDRFARSTKQLVDALEEYQHLGVDFISLTERIDTSTPAGKLVFHVMSAIAEFERELISERVKAGIAKARAQGKAIGRPRIDEEVAAEIGRLRHENKMSLRAIAKRLSVSKETVENYVWLAGRSVRALPHCNFTQRRPVHATYAP